MLFLLLIISLRGSFQVESFDYLVAIILEYWNDVKAKV